MSFKHPPNSIALILLSTFCSFLAVPITTARAASGDATSVVHDRLTTLAADVRHRMAAGARIDTRDLGNAAFTAMLHGDGANVAQSELDLAFAKQDLRTGSPTYGQIALRTTDSLITDPNAAPFFGQGLAAVLSGYANRLSPGYVSSIRPKIDALLLAISHQPVAVTYTNIYLMRAVDLLLIGHDLGEPAYEAEGRSSLRGWIAYTRQNGISEFDSSTYYGADVEALSECYRFATDPTDRKTCQVALDYFWTDIAANYLPAAHKISGPSSREYDFISGNDALIYWLEGVGWEKPAQLATTNLQAAYVEDFITNGGYKPPDSIRAIAFGPPRDVTSTFDTYPGHTRYNSVGRNVSLGCAGGSYGPQDKMLVATFAGPAKSSQLNVLLQKSGVAYGIQTASIKPEHVSPAIACLERGGAAIANFDVDMHLLGPTPRGFETDVIFPIGASLTVNDRPVSLANGDVTIGRSDVLAVASGGGVVALKALRIDSVYGEPTLTLTTDAKATARGAAWLRIAHVPPGATASPGSTMRETFVMVALDDGNAAAATNEVAHAADEDDVGASAWRTGARFPQGRFELVRSSTSRGTMYPSTIDGRPVQRLPFGINGQDVGASIWAGLPY